ncbi:hypothetical protein Dsin_010057 [Dipteronia sinensis]|uniref:Uncharacterized protein n=1 Tax=Dipteronia sinensis TaxID=43782 RepID=A0AAE0ASZ9_9ROSI|nr:hypothetical protein Dsin_010057 [Dipteronia sinensis]
MKLSMSSSISIRRSDGSISSIDGLGSADECRRCDESVAVGGGGVVKKVVVVTMVVWSSNFEGLVLVWSSNLKGLVVGSNGVMVENQVSRKSGESKIRSFISNGV